MPPELRSLTGRRTSSSSATSCAARASRSARASCSTRSRSCRRSTGRDPLMFREALSATLAKSQDDRRVFELVFDRFFFRAAELAAIAEGIAEQGSFDFDPAARCRRSTPTRCGPQIAAALRDGDEDAMRDLARLAIAAFGRPGEGSGVIGVDVQRIRRALNLRTDPQPDYPTDDPRHDGLPRDGDPPLRADPAPRARAPPDRAHAAAAAVPPAQRARPRAAVRPAGRPRRRAPRRDGAQAPAEDPGPGDARPQAPRRRSTCAARCARRWSSAACRST